MPRSAFGIKPVHQGLMLVDLLFAETRMRRSSRREESNDLTAGKKSPSVGVSEFGIQHLIGRCSFFSLSSIHFFLSAMLFSYRRFGKSFNEVWKRTPELRGRDEMKRRRARSRNDDDDRRRPKTESDRSRRLSNGQRTGRCSEGSCSVPAPLLLPMHLLSLSKPIPS